MKCLWTSVRLSPTSFVCTYVKYLYLSFLSLTEQRRTNGWTRLQCDNAFKRNMGNICKRRPWWQKGSCYKYLGIYWIAVRAGGGIADPNPKIHSWCGKSCAKSFGKP